jgi:hypothetical protein
LYGLFVYHHRLIAAQRVTEFSTINRVINKPMLSCDTDNTTEKVLYQTTSLFKYYLNYSHLLRFAAKTADICSNGKCEKIRKKTGPGGLKDTKKTGPAAAAKKALCQGCPAGRGADGDPHRPFGPDFRGAHPPPAPG